MTSNQYSNVYFYEAVGTYLTLNATSKPMLKPSKKARWLTFGEFKQHPSGHICEMNKAFPMNAVLSPFPLDKYFSLGKTALASSQNEVQELIRLNVGLLPRSWTVNSGSLNQGNICQVP